MIKDIIEQAEALEQRIHTLSLTKEEMEANAEEIRRLDQERTQLLAQCADLSAADRVYLARHPKRPHIDDFIEHLFTDFFEQKGDHLYDEDASIYGGIARYKGMPVTVLGHRKGRTMEENIRYNFGMPRPEGYRKALRLMEQAEKFGRPIITFVDTLDDITSIVCSKISIETTVTDNLLLHFSFCELAAVAKLNKGKCRYAVSTFWRECAIAVECTVNVNDFTLLMSTC